MSSGGRRPVVAANWKMNLLKADAAEICRDLRRGLAAPPPADVRVVIFPSFPLIPVVARELLDSEVEVGGQDLHPEDKGAFTGDVSGRQLADASCAWALCGHSERRQYHAESDELVARKAVAAARHRLTPMICLGETGDERRAGQTFAVLERQLRAAVASRPAPFALAYEPVWAIGTGETATPETAQEAHGFLRGLLGELLGEGAAASVPILYGGSATPENAPGLLAQQDIDGFLVGGASLDPQKFLAIIRSSG
ncbi:MAG TPA: triose-phosphate isomerase [Thermoanaerobaculia bacterium]|nr:triose-phosphate isomerase [Thermoanaerobaculia bacterium]